MKHLTVVLICASFILLLHKASGGVTQCYFCEAPCEEVEIRECEEYQPGEYSCYAATLVIGNSTFSARACILDDDTSLISECNNIENTEGASCYICDSNLCNDHE